MQATISSSKPDELSTPERLVALVNDATKHAEELLKAEIAVAKDDLKDEVRAVKGAAIVIGIAAILAHCALFLFAFALVLLLGGTALAAAMTGLIFSILAAVGFVVGKKLISKPPLKNTRSELSRDIHMLAETTHE